MSSGMYSQPANGVQTVVTSTEAAESRAGGGRSYAFWLLVGVVLLVAVFNLLITLTLLTVLRVGVGMESIQMMDRAIVLPFSVDMDSLFKPDGTFLSFQDDPLSINGDGGVIDFLVSASGVLTDESGGQRVSLTHGSVTVQGVAGAGVAAAPGHPAFFSTAFPNFGLPTGVRSLRVQDARIRRVVSPLDSPLKLHSSTQAHLRGAEGTHVDGKSVLFSADQELYLKSVNGSVVLQGAHGVRLDVGGVPWTGRRVSDTSQSQYRLCACVPAGRLFRIAVPLDNEDRPPSERVTCGNAALHGDNNPCA